MRRSFSFSTYLHGIRQSLSSQYFTLIPALTYTHNEYESNHGEEPGRAIARRA